MLELYHKMEKIYFISKSNNRGLQKQYNSYNQVRLQVSSWFVVTQHNL